jgi:hypothetical protein
MTPGMVRYSLLAGQLSVGTVKLIFAGELPGDTWYPAYPGVLLVACPGRALRATPGAAIGAPSSVRRIALGPAIRGAAAGARAEAGTAVTGSKPAAAATAATDKTRMRGPLMYPPADARGPHSRGEARHEHYRPAPGWQATGGGQP